MADDNELQTVLMRREEEIRDLWYQEPWEGLVVRPTADAVQAMGNKGYDVGKAKALLPQGDKLFHEERYDELLMLICDIQRALREAPKVETHPGSPTTLEGIRSAWPKRRTTLTATYDMATYYDKVYGGWLGKLIGGALGLAVEGQSSERIERTHGEIRDYLKKPPETFNDDTAYEILLLHAIEEYGPDFSSGQLGGEWVGHLPLEYTFTAERIAIENMRRGIMPPDSATTDNPFSEWIGAQMKGEVCGLIAPGRPEVALKYAYRDGIIAHEGEGVYGEIFNAVLVSAAFAENSIPRLIEIGLSYVPGRSKFAKVVRDAVEWCGRSQSWREALALVEEAYVGRYNWIHIFPNIAMVIIGLLFGEGDLGRTICITTMCGLDTDCTSGQAGALLGVMLGAQGIPARWKEPLEDRLETSVIGFQRLSISGLSRWTCEMGGKVLANHQRELS